MTRTAADAVVERQLVVLSGCSGGGKSALSSELAGRGFRVFDEPGRRVVRQQLAIDGPALPWRDPALFAELCASLALEPFDRLEASRPLAFCDRSLIDAAVSLHPVPAHLDRAVRGFRYWPRVFLTPPWPELFEQDRERRHGFDAAVAEYERLVTAYPAYGYTIDVVPKLSIGARADWVLARLEAPVGGG